jgi:hypothetical protein
MCSKFKLIVLVILFTLPSSIFSWNNVGHKIVAHIAYSHLTPEARRAVDQLTEEPGNSYSGRSRFAYISNWADWVRSRGDTRFRTWHYIDLPISADGQPVKPPNPINAVYGINHCQVVLKNARASVEEQQTCLKLLVHIVGDIHQPLHSVNRFSALHPKGDLGGNRYLIKSKIGPNLHAYWDRGMGEFKPFQRRKPNTGIMIQLFAEGVEQRHPIAQFSHNPATLTAPAIEWAREGRSIAESFVYQVPEFSAPTSAYQEAGIPIMEARLALAGYRLATMLNTIYNKKCKGSES